MAEIVLENGKYRFHDNEERGGNLRCDRHGKPWRNFVGDKAVYALFLYAVELEKKIPRPGGRGPGSGETDNKPVSSCCHLYDRDTGWCPCHGW